MVIISHNLTNQFGLYGLNHFLLKYGISAEISEAKKPDIQIKCDLGVNKAINDGSVILQFYSNDLHKEIKGYLKIDTDDLPLFEVPRKLNNGGEVIATFKNKDEREMYPCIIIDNNTLILGFDIFNEIGHILSGHLDFVVENDRNGLTKLPVVDMLEKMLFDSLQLVCKQNEVSFECKPFWPDGKKFAVCLTHDVDRVKKTFQYVTHTSRHLKRGEMGLVLAQLSFILKRENPYWNFDEIMEMERRLGVNSTFFFLNEQRNFFCSPSEWKLYWGRYDIKEAEIVKTIKRLDAEGWEIGVHGSYNSYKDLEMLEEEKNILEEILDKKVYGISQHYMNLIPETWKYQEDIGLLYDSSIGFTSKVGFRYGTCFPFHPFDLIQGRVLFLVELPMTIMDNFCSFKKREPDNMWKDIMDAVNGVEKCGGLLVMRWHQEVFNNMEYPGQAEIYEKLIEICGRRNAWVTNAKEIVDWWDSREERIELLEFPKHFLDEYIVVTPCKNEAQNLPRLIESIVSQTLKPALWVIIDDGSTDETSEIIRDAEKKYKWVKGMSLEATIHRRDRGVHLANVMKRGFDFAVKYCMERDIKFDYLGNIDGDIILEPNFVEDLITEFKKEPLLGVASGTTRYIRGDHMIDVKGGTDEPSGGHMIIRRGCYEDCGGIPISYAVDSALKAKARIRGWKTRKFDVSAVEVRDVHSAEGYWKGYKEKSEAAYYLNLSLPHVLFNSMRYLFKRPYYIGITYLLTYFYCFVQKKERTEDEELKNYFRNKWKSKIKEKIKL